MEMNKVFAPQEFESDIYKWWNDNGFFTPVIDKAKIPFTIVIPPPNITGQLHMGHALDNAIQDCIIRYKRMKGFSALWLPGTDHASIATEVKIVEQMQQEGITKEQIGREGFLKRAWKWKDKYAGRIVEQLKRLGSSCDWSREAFTLDDKCSKAVRHFFVDLYNKGLIYQGNRIINWCPVCRTALSDAEVEYTEQQSNLWHFKYLLADGSGSIVIATTRPETIFGDSAVAVNPNDPRYCGMIGKYVILPIVNKPIPIIADDYVDISFGTGALKITPAHDPNDFELGLRHNLEVVRVFNDDGILNQLCPSDYIGLDRFAAREKIILQMKSLNQLIEIKPHLHNVGQCYRCDTTVEPIISKQWFVKMQSLAIPAIEAVKSEKIEFIPKRFEKTYLNWMENIRDWCISRQLWWGHRIPIWYCKECNEIICSEITPTHCPKCNSHKLNQDEDVLDTWFSSALWPMSTLGFPDNTDDFQYFFPTNLLATGYDIIFFWVARMIFSSLEETKQVPFSQVLIHGLVRDEQGRKMSKSLGNGVDPLEIIDKYGSDTLRFSLLFGVASGNDIKFTTDKLDSNRNFMNKVWNAGRFVLQNCANKQILDINNVELSLADKWILTKLNEAIADVTGNLDKYELGNASAKLYDFIWNEFCDWYIEFSKPILYSNDETKRTAALSVLCYILDKLLKLLHPFAPFITEQMYQSTPNHSKTIMQEDYPSVNSKLIFDDETVIMDQIRDMITKIRNLRAEMQVIPSKRIRLSINTSITALSQASVYIEKLAGAEEVIFTNISNTSQDVISLVCQAAEVYIPLGDMVDTAKEIERITKELAVTESEIARATSKLANDGFVSKAPQSLIDSEKTKLANFIEIMNKLTIRLQQLTKK